MRSFRLPISAIPLYLIVLTLGWVGRSMGQDLVHRLPPLTALPPATQPVAAEQNAPAPTDRPLTINLPTALQLAGARPMDIAIASERLQASAAQLDRAKVLWLPNLYLGGDYYRHDGQLQDVGGAIFGTSKSSLMVGAGPVAVFAVSDAIFAPLAARQVVRARQAGVQAALNDSLLAVGEAYFNVQQSRGELAGAEDAARRAEELTRRAEKLVAAGVIPPVETPRVRAEAARRRQAIHAARERWRLASAELARVLRLDAAALLEPVEPPHLRITLVPPERTVDELIPVGLMNRPELAAQQALVQATLDRLRQERLRPLVPSVLLRGTSTNPTGTLAGGYFGGGHNGRLGDFSARSDFDIQVLWELENLGFGNRARVNERRAESRLATFELFRTQDRVAAEVVQAHAQARSAADRIADAEAALKDAVESAERNFEGLGQTQPAGKALVLVIRPQEAVAAVQALAQAYNDYYGALADHGRAQFRLYRALGHPAEWLTRQADCPEGTPGAVGPGSQTPATDKHYSRPL